MWILFLGDVGCNADISDMLKDEDSKGFRNVGNTKYIYTNQKQCNAKISVEILFSFPVD